MKLVRTIIVTVVASCAAISSLARAAAPASQPAAKKRNVVVFVADDLGARDLGFTGSTFYESPNLDKLAARGAVFTQAYAACPVCSPTRAALMTGKYPPRTGVTDFIGGPQPDEATTQPRFRNRALLPAPYEKQLALDFLTVGEAFKAAGYATYFTGKWHLGGPKYFPDKQGFDTIVGVAGGTGKSYLSPFAPSLRLPPGPVGEQLDIRLANEAAKWLEKQQPADTPFLLWVSLYDVHIPLQAPPETIQYFEDKRKKLNLSDEFGTEGKSKLRLNQSHAIYAAMVKSMDDAVGIVVKQLEQQKLLDDTIILFTSDNGGVATSEGWPTTNLPLRGGKGWAYEGGVRVPMFAVVPGVTKSGERVDTPAISMDLFPTLLAACGLAPKPEDHQDGINLLPTLQGDATPPRPLFWHYPHYGNQGGEPFSSVRDGNLKLILFHDSKQPVELYDLSVDPEEKHNLAADRADDVKRLRATLDAWKKDVRAVDAKPRE
jgi:arylsulfatase A-like enzyme